MPKYCVVFGITEEVDKKPDNLAECIGYFHSLQDNNVIGKIRCSSNIITRQGIDYIPKDEIYDKTLRKIIDKKVPTNTHFKWIKLIKIEILNQKEFDLKFPIIKNRYNTNRDSLEFLTYEHI